MPRIPLLASPSTSGCGRAWACAPPRETPLQGFRPPRFGGGCGCRTLRCGPCKKRGENVKVRWRRPGKAIHSPAGDGLVRRSARTKILRHKRYSSQPWSNIFLIRGRESRAGWAYEPTAPPCNCCCPSFDTIVGPSGPFSIRNYQSFSFPAWVMDSASSAIATACLAAISSARDSRGIACP